MLGLKTRVKGLCCEKYSEREKERRGFSRSRGIGRMASVLGGGDWLGYAAWRSRDKSAIARSLV